MLGARNGYSTIQLASQRAIEIRGLDYLPEMIERARASLQVATLIDARQSRVRCWEHHGHT